jgi:HEPN domain-containing protein
MSSLPNSNREVAEEWLRRAAWRHSTGVRAVAETGDTTEAVRDLASAAELALKAVYIKLGSLFPRSHNVSALVEECPDRTVLRVLEGYSEQFVKDFSRNYLAPYLRARPVPPADVEECRRFSERIMGWAEGAIDT